MEKLYTFKKTEKNNKKASDFETKAMLYLLGMRNDSDEIEIITIDCFNDVTGANDNFTKLWDVQSKNHQSLPPSKIGVSLLTLYENYISNINFTYYILFIPKLENSYLVDPSLTVYTYENINKNQQKGIESKIKKLVSGDSNDPPPLLADFLSCVFFVEDCNDISSYIKNISKFNNSNVIPNDLYESIFEEIRNIQTGLKNSEIEGEVIQTPRDVLKYKRHITKKEISTLLINRLLGVEVFGNTYSIPLPFLPVTQGKDEEEIKDLILDCNSNLSRAFFDKNSCLNFWKISEFLFTYVRENQKDDIFQVNNALKSSITQRNTYLTEETVLFMISLIISGFKNED